ncbi:small G protein signaling modulator 2 isoform X19 [Homo sapiens]|uniref:small G protein signaling modulator 2 isoform X19 n=1 Tax=Homo sapiens TaxID=9606 RepID=UPI0005D000E4|nr:small G protein signaling modulator 2 isoform X19 [Homo sapiens]|eukprot:XP_011522412.1 small G protein signaling modulator 2 isoform X13 [Homo sapiens]
MGSAEDAVKEKLLWNVKKEVKQIMEEAVTRKFVHEDSSHIIALCAADPHQGLTRCQTPFTVQGNGSDKMDRVSAAGAYILLGRQTGNKCASAVEACLLHQLRRRAAGFLRSDKMAALFTKVGKTCPVAGEICHKVQELQQQAEGRKPSGVSQEALRRQGSASGKAPALSPQALKHVWVRTALIEKVLDKVVQYLAENCSKYYEKEALLADPVFGPILASLLGEPESTGTVGTGQVLREHRLGWLSLSPQWDPVPWNTLSSRQPITTGLTPLLMSWSSGTASGVHLLARTPLQSAQPWGSGNGTQAAARRRTGWLPVPASVWSPCTRTHGRGCSMARTTCWCSRPSLRASQPFIVGLPVSPAVEGGYGGGPWLPLPAPVCREPDSEVDPQPAHEWDSGGLRAGKERLLGLCPRGALQPGRVHPLPPAKERWHACAGEPGWHPEAAAAFPTGRTPAVLSVLSGEWAAASGTARAPAVDPAREGESVPQATETKQHSLRGYGGDGHGAGHRLCVPDHLPRPQARAQYCL